MLTYLQIVNRVLARLREASVTTVNSSTYSTLIAAIVNQVKAEMEDAYYWNALRDTYAVNTVIGTTSYAFTGAGPKAVVIDGWDTTSPAVLSRGTNADFNSYFFGTTSVQSGAVQQYLPAGLSPNYDLKVDVWPKPDAVYALKFNVYAPQVELSGDSDVPLVPQSVLIEEVIARAKAERGDEDAPKPTQPGDTFVMRELLMSAISRESDQDPHEMDWEVE